MLVPRAAILGREGSLPCRGGQSLGHDVGALRSTRKPISGPEMNLCGWLARPSAHGQDAATETRISDQQLPCAKPLERVPPVRCDLGERYENEAAARQLRMREQKSARDALAACPPDAPATEIQDVDIQGAGTSPWSQVAAPGLPLERLRKAQERSGSDAAFKADDRIEEGRLPRQPHRPGAVEARPRNHAQPASLQLPHDALQGRRASSPGACDIAAQAYPQLSQGRCLLLPVARGCNRTTVILSVRPTCSRIAGLLAETKHFARLENCLIEVKRSSASSPVAIFGALWLHYSNVTVALRSSVLGIDATKSQLIRRRSHRCFSTPPNA